jgi:hypothetical protein
MTNFQKSIFIVALLMFGGAFLGDLIFRLAFIPDYLQVYALIGALLIFLVAVMHLAEKMGVR